jgi:type IV secretion system protein VirB2
MITQITNRLSINATASLKTLLLVTLLIGAEAAMAQAAAIVPAATIAGFFGSVQTLLNTISIVVVTVAFTYSGYQVAFNSKRMAEVMPVIIGALMVGAASQLGRIAMGGAI